MKKILVYEPLETDNEFCRECGYMTIHIIQFSEYLNKPHKVVFYLYCKECYERIGNQTMCYKVTVPADDWKRMITSNEPDN